MPMANEQPFYHVFLSYRGPDTGNSFTCLLNKELKRLKLISSVDDMEKPTPGVRIAQKIENAIRNSMSAIIIFSENYALSRWCLMELSLILERKKSNPDYMILPIYLHGVVPRDVRYQLGKIHDALETHKTWCGPEKVEEWRAALNEVANYNAEIVHGDTADFVNRVATRFKTKFDILIKQRRYIVSESTVKEDDAVSIQSKRLKSKEF